MNYVNVSEPAKIEAILKQVHVIESLAFKMSNPTCIFFESYFGKGYIATGAYNSGFELFIEERIAEHKFSYNAPKDESRISETAKFRIRTLCNKKPTRNRELLEKELVMNSDIAEFLCIERHISNGEY